MCGAGTDTHGAQTHRGHRHTGKAQTHRRTTGRAAQDHGPGDTGVLGEKQQCVVQSCGEGGAGPQVGRHRGT